MKESDDLELQITADEMCRTCLAQLSPDQLRPIFCSEIVDGKIIAFPKILQATMGFKPVKHDSFPNNVCISCKTKLKELFSFKEKISNSEDLLYDIFRMEKPVMVPEVPLPPPKPTMVTAGIQTDLIQIDEADESSYAHFLSIEKAEKQTLQDFSCQANPSTQEDFCQTDPALKPVMDASIQTASEVLLQESETPTDMLVSNLEHEGHFLDLDVIQEDDDQDIESLEEQAFESVIDDDVEHINFFVEMTNDVSKSAGVKLEQIDEDEHFVEYMSIEALEDSTLASHTVTKSASKSPKTSNKKVTHQCNYCEYSTQCKKRFTSHIDVHQQSLESIFEKVDYFRCTDCNSVHGTSSALDKHFRAGSCERVDAINFTPSADEKKHNEFYTGNGFDICLPRLKSFHKGNKTSILCGQCDLPFKTLKDAVLHFVSNHESDSEAQLEVEQMWEENGYNQIHTCGICNEQFPDASFIRQHIYFHRSVHECPFGCKQKFASFLELTEHIEHSHLNNSLSEELLPNKLVPRNTKPELMCDICFKLFSSVASMKIHKKNHYADRRYTCHMCSKAFIQKSDLTIHIRSHTDERPFFCTFQGCDKRFRTSSHRRDHMSTHAVENRFQCEHCNKYFKASRILQGHMRLHTGSKPFECEICPKRFIRKQHLKLHMKTHA